MEIHAVERQKYLKNKPKLNARVIGLLEYQSQGNTRLLVLQAELKEVKCRIVVNFN